MLKQLELLELLKSSVTSHEFRTEGNKIYGKSLIRSRSFRSFTLTYIKNSKDTISLSAGGGTMRYTDTNNLITALGSMAYIKQ